MAETKIALTDLAEVTRWSFETPPTLQLSLRSPDGIEYPRRKRPIDAIIDTGFEYEVLVSNDIYEALELRKWEYPDQRPFEMMDRRQYLCWEAVSGVSITRTDIYIPEVPIVTPIENDGQTYILLGADFLKRLQILLLGNSGQPEIVLLRHKQ